MTACVTYMETVTNDSMYNLHGDGNKCGYAIRNFIAMGKKILFVEFCG